MITNITIYPEEGAEHSSSGDLSALAGYAKALFRAMPESVRKRHVVLSNVKSGARRVYHDDGLEIRECWRKGSWGFAWDIWRQVNADPDCKVIHLQHEFNQFGGVATLPLQLALLAAFRVVLGLKIAVTVHEVLAPDLIRADFLRRTGIPAPAPLARLGFAAYYRILGWLADILVVQDEHFADVLRTDYGVRTEMEIVRIGTDRCEPVPRREARARLGIPQEAYVLLFFGTLDWRKGLDVLLQACARLPTEKFCLILGGGRPRRIQHTPGYEAWWSEIAAEIDRQGNVRTLGFVRDADIPVVFGSADLMVLPYLIPQKVSAVFNQAASYGLPCLVSNAFASLTHPEMVMGPAAEDIAEKIQWAAAQDTARLKRHSEDFCARNSWRASAEAMGRIHEKLIGRAR